MDLEDALGFIEHEVEKRDFEGSYWQDEKGGPKITTRQCFEYIKAKLTAQAEEIERLKTKGWRSVIPRLEGKIATLQEECRLERGCLNSIQAMVVDTVGGIVEERPTHEGNYLQRLRELVGIEIQHEEMEQELASLRKDRERHQKLDELRSQCVRCKAGLYLEESLPTCTDCTATEEDREDFEEAINQARRGEGGE